MIQEAGGEAIFVQTDVSKYEDVEALVDKAVATFGRIDVMFNKLTQPEQIADSVYLLSLPEASAINGSVVMVDEGYASFK
ncbi:NAD(P)-dependent dehydrogenase (short-subunit alcohol dehydrogenase family) [Brevibacillus nitrificans]|nr:NAD(P)-dependent dehydrogenase (short-subunit alcohol dehydrogenase family) [Brevibacillus nitrificans]